MEVKLFLQLRLEISTIVVRPFLHVIPNTVE